jgi:hypothetical protein
MGAGRTQGGRKTGAGRVLGGRWVGAGRAQGGRMAGAGGGTAGRTFGPVLIRANIVMLYWYHIILEILTSSKKKLFLIFSGRMCDHRSSNFPLRNSFYPPRKRFILNL